jgi:D-alanine-D-alanine ligase-like ATP-grasp enzyme
MPRPRYLLVVNHVVSSLFKSVEEIKKISQFTGLETLIITKDTNLANRYSKYINPRNILICSFDDDNEIESILKPYTNDIVGVICRGDKHIQYLRKVIPFLPDQTLVSSVDSLTAATNKSLMRQKFIDMYPEITPDFLEVFDSSDETVSSVEAKIGFPVIVKPANLYSSLLIRSCSNQDELKSALSAVFSAAQDAYRKEGISEQPSVIVEEYLVGELFSTDAFVLSGDQISCCPLVPYISAKNLGIDDFFLYKRYMPADLSKAEISEAFETAKKAIIALGLIYSAAHIELIKTAKGWKVIEVGPRLGRFRNVMYKLCYGIDLSLNDVRVHLGLEPRIPDRLIRKCTAYSIYPKKEGRLKKIVGIGQVKTNHMTKSFRLLAKSGDECLFAKNGGHALAEFIVAGTGPSYDEATKYVEERVYADID